MIAAGLAGLLAGWAVALPLGAVGAYLMSVAARTSVAVAIRSALGVAVVDAGYAAAAVIGGRAAAARLAAVAGALHWVAAVVLAVLAVRLLRSSAADRIDDRASDQVSDRAGGFRRFAGLTALNPGTWAYFVAFVAGAGAGSIRTFGQGSAFVLGVFLASSGWQCALAGIGRLLGRAAGPGRARALRVLAAAVMAVLAVRSTMT